MSTRRTRRNALKWLRKHWPNKIRGETRTSKFYEDNLWFFTLPCDYFYWQGDLNMLLQKPDNLTDFYFLQVPFKYFTGNQNTLNVRRNNDKFDLRISANANNWLVDTRSGLSFAEFEQNHGN